MGDNFFSFSKSFFIHYVLSFPFYFFLAGEMIGAASVLSKEQLLFHFNLKQPGVIDLRIKSGSERLNDCLYKFINAAL